MCLSTISYFGKSMELYFHLPSKLAQVITLLTCVWEVVFILEVTLTILTVFFFVVFLIPSRHILGYYLKSVAATSFPINYCLSSRHLTHRGRTWILIRKQDQTCFLLLSNSTVYWHATLMET
jgi:sensor histidine kinase YesM